MNKVELNIFGVKPSSCGCGCEPGTDCGPTRTVMDDIQDLKGALKKEGLVGKLSSMKFIDVFSLALEKYPRISKEISDGNAEVPIVAFGEEIISADGVDIKKIIDRLKAL